MQTKTRKANLMFLLLVCLSMIGAQNVVRSHAAETQLDHWVRCGVVYITPSSPQNPYVLTPDPPPRSWWTQHPELFEQQKKTDNQLLTHLLGNTSSRTIIVYFPQFLADREAYGDEHLRHLESVTTYFYEEGYQVILFLGRPDHRAVSGDDIDPIRHRADRDYLLENIGEAIFYGKIHDYVSEVSVYWMGARYDWGHEPGSYTEEEVQEYNQEIKELINSAGDLFYLHVDGPWWEQGCVMNGYAPDSVSPASGASDGLFAESWAQGTLPAGLDKIIPEYFDPLEVLMCASIPNYNLASNGEDERERVRQDVDFWFETIEDAGIRSWFLWDYYGLEEGVPGYHSVITPDATDLTYKGHLVSEIARRENGGAIRDKVIMVQRDTRQDFEVLVDGESITSPHEFRWDRGSNHTLEVLETTVEEHGTRYIFERWAGMEDSATSSLTCLVQRPGKLILDIGVYHEVNIDPVYGGDPISEWYRENDTVSYTVEEIEITLGEGVRVLFDSWSGDVHSDETEVSFNASSPIDVVANWNTQYYLIVEDNVGGSVTSSSPSGWLDAGSQVAFSATPDPGFTFSSWIGSGSGSYSGPESSHTVTLNGPITEKPVFIDIAAPIADAGLDRTSRVGETVIFDGMGSRDNVGIIICEWDFGDGTTGTFLTTTHVYNEPGTYTVTMTVKDRVGNTAEDKVIITVEEPTEQLTERWIPTTWILYLVGFAIVMGMIIYLVGVR